MKPYINIILTACVGVLNGCGNTSWVKPYEQANVRHPVMAVSVDPLLDRMRQRSFAQIEGARGASQHGGACNCN